MTAKRIFDGWAAFSPGVAPAYRYLLGRGVRQKPFALFVMLNPSTGSASDDDATIVRCRVFASNVGLGSLRIVNLFAWRATNPRDLAAACRRGEDVVGPGNDAFIVEQAQRAVMTICAWGNGGSLGGRDLFVLAMLRDVAKVQTLALSVTKEGQPGHPLYLPSTRLPQLYERPAPRLVQS